MEVKNCKFLLISAISFVISAVIASLPFAAHAQSYPQGFRQTMLATVTLPTNMAFAPDGRIFICEQKGRVRVYKNGTLLSTPFISLSVDSRGERGLLGIAFHPNFASNGWVYLFYTMPNGTNNRVIRVKASGDVAVMSSMQTVLTTDPLSGSIHGNGGSIKFGPDQKLYIASGYNVQDNKSQDLNSYLGKLLRVNPDGSAPPDNPFPSGSQQARRVWCYGLKNPYTFDIDRATGKIYFNDVGEHTWEEINDATMSNKNFGWPNAEGNSTNSKYTNPVYAYNHNGNASTTGCAVSGGAFLPANSNYPQVYKNRYYFMDVCGGWINSIPLSGTITPSVFATGIGGTSGAYSTIALTGGPDGNLYFLSRQTGSLYKITYSGSLVAQNAKTGTAIQSPQADIQSEISIYPTPANQSVLITIKDLKTTNNLLTIYDQKGVLLKTVKIAGTTTAISTSAFANGVYFIVVNDGKKEIKQKFEVSH